MMKANSSKVQTKISDFWALPGVKRPADLEEDSDMDSDFGLESKEEGMEGFRDMVWSKQEDDKRSQRIEQQVKALASHDIDENLLETLRTSFAEFSLNQKSRKQYKSNQRSVEKRGYPFSVGGFLRLIMSGKKEDLALANSSLDCIASSLKHKYFEENLVEMPDHLNKLISKALAGRRRKHPDSRRVTGAMTFDRTQAFVAWINNNNDLPESQKQLFSEVAWMMYACALRIFQLEALMVDSFYSVEVKKEVMVEGARIERSETDLFVRVPAKGGERNQRDFERKQVDPKSVEKVEEIIRRRVSQDPNTSLFADLSANNKKYLGKLLMDFVRYAKLPDQHKFRLHSFRHGAAFDAFVEGGHSLLAVRLRTGHLSDVAAKHYARSDLERTKDCLSRGKESEEHLRVKQRQAEDEYKKIMEEKEQRGCRLQVEEQQQVQQMEGQEMEEQEEQQEQEEQLDVDSAVGEETGTSLKPEERLCSQCKKSLEPQKKVVMFPKFFTEPLEVEDMFGQRWSIPARVLTSLGILNITGKAEPSRQELGKIQNWIDSEKIRRRREREKECDKVQEEKKMNVWLLVN